MDNITHSLTGALAAKLINSSTSEEKQSAQRTIFLLLVISANLPDMDVALRWSFNYFYYVVEHRGITHSLVFAPALALLPASIFYYFSKLKKFSLLWLVALLGIFLHICFDVITSFGTRIFVPLSSQRYAFDWMFIIDPWFTGILALTMILQKRFKHHARLIARSGFGLACLYLLAEVVSHNIAVSKVERTIAERHISVVYFSAIPQPLNIFRWNGLIQTDKGVQQGFFSVFDDSLHLKEYKNAESDSVVAKVLAGKVVRDYFTFARHPWINSWKEGGKRIVELRDFQFAVDEWLLKAFRAEGTPQPFCLRFEFSADGTEEKVLFNDEEIQK